MRIVDEAGERMEIFPGMQPPSRTQRASCDFVHPLLTVLFIQRRLSSFLPLQWAICEASSTPPRCSCTPERDVYYGERTLARSLGISRQVEHKKKGTMIKAKFGGERINAERSFFIRCARIFSGRRNKMQVRATQWVLFNFFLLNLLRKKGVGY